MEWPVKLTGDLTPLAQSGAKVIDRIADVAFGGRECREVWRKTMQEAQTEKDRQKIASGEWEFNGKKLVPSLVLKEYPPSNGLLMIEHEQETRNLVNCLSRAVEIAQNIKNEDVADGNIEPDWFARWRREVKVISEEQLRNMWARILVEEGKNPQKISYRTLEVLINLTKDELQLFAKMGRWFTGGLLPCESNYNFLDFNIKDYMKLADCGLILYPKIIVSCGTHHSNNTRALCSLHNAFIIYSDDAQSEEFNFIEGIAVSNAGNDLLRIADLEPLSKDEIAKLCNFIMNIPRESIIGGIRVYPLIKPDTYDFSRLIYEARGFYIKLTLDSGTSSR